MFKLIKARKPLIITTKPNNNTMAKKKEIGSKMNGLFKFNEVDYIAGFYQGTAKVKHGEAVLISDLDKKQTVGVPLYATLKKVPDQVEEGEFLLLQYKGMEKSDNSGQEYMNIKAISWEMESDEEAKSWNEEKCNVAEILDQMPEYVPDAGSQATLDEDPEDDLPF